MKRNRLIILAICVLLPLLGTFNACSRARFTETMPNGTSTLGNPYAPTGQKIVGTLCAVISRCHPQASSLCETEILETPGFANSLNISNQNYDTLGSVLSGEISGELMDSASAGNQCQNEIQALSCSDVDLQNAFNPNSTVPFSGSTALVESNSCQQVYKSLVNLEVPIELVDYGLSSRTTSVAFSRTQTTFNSDDYDGQTNLFFEVVATNSDTQARSVSLIGASNQIVATLNIPAATNVATRLRASINSVAMGSGIYRVQLDGTTTPDQLLIFAARILVQQMGATKTKIYIPLIGYLPGSTTSADDSTASIDHTLSNTYQQNNNFYYGQWKKDLSAFSDLDPAQPFTFEVVFGASGATPDTVYATLYNATSGAPVGGSEVTTRALSPTLLNASFSNAAANFVDQNLFEVRIRRTDTINGRLFKAGLWIKLVNLSHAEVYYRFNKMLSGYLVPSNIRHEQEFAMISTSAFNQNFTLHSESAGWVNQAGTACAIQLIDLGQSDFNVSGLPVANSPISFSTTSKSITRSQALLLQQDHRVIGETLPTNGPGTCWISQPRVVVKF